MDKGRILFFKPLVIIIILLFFGTSFSPIINGNYWINYSISQDNKIEENAILYSQQGIICYKTINRYQESYGKSFGSYPESCGYVYFLYPPRELEWEYNNENFDGTLNQFRLLASDNTNHTWNLNSFELHINGINNSNPDNQSFYRRYGAHYEWEIIWRNISQYCTGIILFEILYLDCDWIEYKGDFDDDGDETFHYSHFNPRSFIDGTLNGDYIFDSDKAYIVWYTPTNYTPPDCPSKPAGNTTGYICIDHSYSTSTTDPDGLNLSYGWDWDGDFVVDEWTDWYESNETCTITHNWSNPGIYYIGVKAKNTLGNESNWSSQLEVTILNHPPYAPSNPDPFDGAQNVSVEGVLCWNGGDPDICDTVVYDVYFGPNPDPPLVSYHQKDTCYDPGSLPFFEDFYWRVYAWDNHGASNSSQEWTFRTGKNEPPDAPEIDGPSRWPVGVELCINISSTDPLEQKIKYEVEWDDGATDETSFYNSGESNEICHTYEIKGVYVIKVRAIDEYGAESNFSEFEIIIPRNKDIFYSILLRLFERYPLVERLLLYLLK